MESSVSNPEPPLNDDPADSEYGGGVKFADAGTLTMSALSNGIEDSSVTAGDIVTTPSLETLLTALEPVTTNETECIDALVKTTCATKFSDNAETSTIPEAEIKGSEEQTESSKVSHNVSDSPLSEASSTKIAVVTQLSLRGTNSASQAVNSEEFCDVDKGGISFKSARSSPEKAQLEIEDDAVGKPSSESKQRDTDKEKEEEMEVCDFSVEEDAMVEKEENLTDIPIVTVVNKDIDRQICNITSNNLGSIHVDELMEMGTVDELDQEAQMEEGDKKNSVQEEGSDSMPSIVNIGRKMVDVGVNQEAFKEVEETTTNRSYPSSPAETKVSSVDTERQPVSPVLVNVKDEPIDDEYDQALISNTSMAGIKDEPDSTEGDLKISAVFSGGRAASLSETTANVAAVTQAVGLPTTNPTEATSPLIPLTLHVACSGCKKVLMKGQTAYQRKGSTDLYCSTVCLSSHRHPAIKPKPQCHFCVKFIASQREVILAPVDNSGKMKDFCSNNCLSAFNSKRNSALSVLSSAPYLPKAMPSKCSQCTKSCISKHEVILKGAVHKLCSDECFGRFRASHKLAMNSCWNCGHYCYTKALTLKLENINKSFCKTECVASYKKKLKKPSSCTMCRASRPVCDMVETTDGEGKVDLFCTSSCVMAYKVQTVSASGVSLLCDNCQVLSVPAYHLAMSDSSIRNFCTLPCVLTFQEKYNKTNQRTAVAVTTSTTTTTSTATHDVEPPVVKLSCSQCHTSISTKPLLLQIKNELMFFCGLGCCEEFKKINSVVELCEYCKTEKVTREVLRINDKDCAFCSEGCKLLYRHDLSKRWGRHCLSCAFCACTSQKLVSGQYGGKDEDFCSEDCWSKFTLLFCQMARCDLCGRQRKLEERLYILGEIKHFCDMLCLISFCSRQTVLQAPTPKTAFPTAPAPSTTVTTQSTPVIANVVSLANAPNGLPNILPKTVTQGVVPKVLKFLGNADTQTETVRVPPPKVLKNKSLLCKPMVQNKGVFCKPQMVHCEVQTENNYPEILVLPVPVPIFVPVPMNMYSQFTPKPFPVPIPLPVPIFLPVTLDNAERIVETIQEIKAKIPSNPFEADLILMAEMVAEGEKDAMKKSEGPYAHYDQASNYSEDLDTDGLTNFLNDWEEPTSSHNLLMPNRLLSKEKLNPIIDIPVGQPPTKEPAPSPIMDIETDYPVETLEEMAHLREKAQLTPSTLPPVRKQRARRKVRGIKKGHKPLRSAEVQTVAIGESGACEPPKLYDKYGVDAWKRWIQWRSKQPNIENPRFGSRPLELKEDILQCTTTELSYGLCRFVAEVKRPDGQPYKPDSLFYLCLGIQQSLFDNGRIENIFTDVFYGKFSIEITALLKDFKPSVTKSGYIHSRVEEEYLWHCKQLGAYSPIVLLNTLLFFCTKHFGFKTVAQHRQLSFAHIMRCTKSNSDNTKTNFLRFYPPISLKTLNASTTDDGVPAKKRKMEEEKEEVLEMFENSANPLRCPVRLYEFYLSKCSESVKQRTNMFYLNPERSCVPNSPMWYSSTPLDYKTMEAMLTRILTVREMHLKPDNLQQEQEPMKDDPPFIPSYEDQDSD